LIWAATYNQVKVAKVLLERGADVNAREKDGGTALMCAAKDGNVKSVKFLLEHGADVHIKSNDGNTALDWATGNAQVIALLKQAGAKK